MTDSLGTGANEDHEWWRDAVIYQVYPRSFADSDGDGLGDIDGIRSRLDYLRELGVDALWINPWYPSPMCDAGYDVSDFRAIEPHFGTLQSGQSLIDEAHALGLRVLLDIVPNHVSDRHRLFVAALGSAAGSPERELFYFRPGCGAAGDLPPNDWQSNFGGPAWTRVVAADGQPGEWYLHLFAPGQPDVNWESRAIREEYEQTLRFWFDRGVDGFRIDVAHGLVKAPGLPDAGGLGWPLAPDDPRRHPTWDQDGVHEIYRSWRRIADSYEPPRIFVAEAWVLDRAQLAKYVRPDELNTTFNFEFLLSPFTAAAKRETIAATLQAHDAVGAPATWVLANHDVVREVSRFARPQVVRELDQPGSLNEVAVGRVADLEVGLRRARAAALLMLSLPGGAYIYQGEELGLAEVEDLPEEVLQDPTWEQSGHTDRGRDGCRVPIPWSGQAPPFGFGPAGSRPWLPQPAGWAALSVAAQAGKGGSTLELCRAALSIRRSHAALSTRKSRAALGAGGLEFVELGADVLAFRRSPGFMCVVNFGALPIALPEHRAVLLGSEPLEEDGRLGSDTAVWLSL